MNDPKAAAAYHPGDGHVTRPDLDELIGRVYYAAEWAFSSAPDALQEALWEAGAAIESERERADQAERDVKRYEYRARENRELLDQFAARADQAAAHLAAVEERVTDALLMGTRLDSVKADVMRALQPYAAPTAEQ